MHIHTSICTHTHIAAAPVSGTDKAGGKAKGAIGGRSVVVCDPDSGQRMVLKMLYILYVYDIYMCVCIYIYICVCVCVCVCVYICTCIHIYIYTYITYIYVFIAYLCMSFVYQDVADEARLCCHVFVCVRACVCACVCVCVHTLFVYRFSRCC
jgi:hypothetical protein